MQRRLYSPASNNISCSVTVALFCLALLQIAAIDATAKEPSLDLALPSVVTVNAGDRSGAGFVCGTDQWIATCLHVVIGVPDVSISLEDGRSVKVDGYCCADESKDVVLLHLERPSGRKPLVVAQKLPAVGTEVFAIGNPHGLGGTVSKGIVSAIRAGTQVKRLDSSSFTKRIVKDDEQWVQFDAPIQPGNSGGPLVTQTGGVVGIVSRGLFDKDISFAASVTDLAGRIARPADLKPKPLGRMKEDTPELAKIVDEVVDLAFQTKDMWLLADKEGDRYFKALMEAEDRLKEIREEDTRRQEWITRQFQGDAVRRRIEQDRCFMRWMVKCQTVFLTQLVATDRLLMQQELTNKIYAGADRELVEAMDRLYKEARVFRDAVWAQHKLLWDYVNSDKVDEQANIAGRAKAGWNAIDGQAGRLVEAAKSRLDLKPTLEKRYLMPFDPYGSEKERAPMEASQDTANQ
jgi:hypothetical protein